MTIAKGPTSSGTIAETPASDTRIAAPPRDPHATWLIARRAAIESLRDRMTFAISVIWALVIPIVIVLFVIHPLVLATSDPSGRAGALVITIYLFVVGLMPSSGAIGIAAGVFAGEKEQGSLLPLLATPASNRAIFAGKVLGAVLPALLYASVAEVSYLMEIWLIFGATTLRSLPLGLVLVMLVLVAADAVLGAAVASVVSSRVRTYQSAQMIASLALVPIMAALFGLVFQLPHWGPWAPLLAVVCIIVLDGVLIVIGAATWQREEVMARC